MGAMSFNSPRDGGRNGYMRPIVCKGEDDIHEFNRKGSHKVMLESNDLRERGVTRPV